MKKIFALAAFATLIASPAFAQQSHRAQRLEAATAYDQQVGTDPDANVRTELQRNSEYYLSHNGG